MARVSEWGDIDLQERVEAAWRDRRYLSPDEIRAFFPSLANRDDADESLLQVFRAFSGSDLSVDAAEKAASAGDPVARAVRDMQRLDPEISVPPYEKLSAEAFHRYRALIAQDPDRVHDGSSLRSYPYHVPGRTYGYDMIWVRAALRSAERMLDRFARQRTSDVAVIVGNGPSLNKTDFSLLEGQDVFISNYAVKHPELAKHAKGLAVSNYLVAEQEPYQFMLRPDIWKFFPLWLRNVIFPDEKTVFLDAQGGSLFFSRDAARRIAWHSTVTYFWLQIVYRLGYRKVLMIGFDHSYNQASGAKEGDLIKQGEDDPNHFDPRYFKGKTWQAADVSKMEATYVRAKKAFEQDGREIVNCTVGGALEVFRRGGLAEELRTPAAPPAKRQYREPKIAVVTPFWKGDVETAERHWRIIRRLGCPTGDHIHLFKHGRDQLPPVTFENVICADVDKAYPEESQKPHPAGPNLTFVHAVRLLKEKGYTHFFWLEPDCVPTKKHWLHPFADEAAHNPDAPVIGVGGGALSPQVPHWKHHFAGCSLYNLDALSKIDWSRYLREELDVSFDVWLSRELGYIKLLEINDEDQQNTIIFGEHRYDWEELNRPDSVVTGMFEHWRPQKFLSQEQLKGFVDSGNFGLFHAIKDEGLQRHIHKRIATSASLIIINYNNEAFLAEAIDSALEQTGLEGVEYEVIVVDDGSTDGSIDIIHSYGDRVTPILLDHGGLNGNFNQQRALKEALKVATGDVICLLDGDDACNPQRVARMAKLFGDAEVVVAQHPLTMVSDDGAPVGSSRGFLPEGDITPVTMLDKSKANLFQPTSGLAFRASYLRTAVQWLAPDIFHRTWLDVRLTRFAPWFGRVVASKEELGKWRRHAGSDSISTSNLRHRLVEHHDWINHVGRHFDFRLPYRGSKHERGLSKTDDRLRVDSDNCLHLTDGEDGLSLHSSSDNKSLNDAWRGRMALIIGQDTQLDAGPVETLSRLDLLLPEDMLGKVEMAFFRHHHPRRVYGDGDGAAMGYAFVLCKTPDSLDPARAHEAGMRLGRKVYFIASDTEADTAPASPATLATLLGHDVVVDVSTGMQTLSGINACDDVNQRTGTDTPLARLRDDLLIAHFRDARLGDDFAAYNVAPVIHRLETKELAEKAIELPREKHAEVDETAVVAHMMASRKGPSNVMLDVGAHIGTSASYFNALGWRILCFEPDAGNRERLTGRFGEAPNVSIDPRAVSNKPATGISFFTSDESTGISGLHAFRDSHEETAQVDVTTVANIADDNDLSSVAFLKIDVEGFDFSVLKGIPWKTLKPDVIECEFEDAKTKPMGHTWQDIADYLQARGYAVYVSEWHPIIRYGISHDWKTVMPYAFADVATEAWGNLVAFREDPGFDAVNAAFRRLTRFRASQQAAATPPATAKKETPALRTDDLSGAKPFDSRLLERLPGRLTGPVKVGLVGLRGLWRRRFMLLPVLAGLALLIALSFMPMLEDVRGLLWGVAAFTLLTLGLGYLAMRTFHHLTRLSLEVNELRRALAKKEDAT